MQSTVGETLLQFGHILQGHLFGRLEQEIGPLGERARLLVAVLALVSVRRHCGNQRGYAGRPAKDRDALANAFVAKAVYGLETTRQLIGRLETDCQLRCLCGWNTLAQIPHEATFSRAFAEFAHSQLPQRLHAAVVECTQKERLIGHIARDSTAIEAREKFPEPKPKGPKQKRRPKRCKASQRGTRLERQRKQTLAQQLAELPQDCGIGSRRAAKGISATGAATSFIWMSPTGRFRSAHC